MKVIFGRDASDAISGRMTVLELDTFFQEGLNEPITAFAVLENTDVPIQELPLMENHLKLHNTMLLEYRKKNFSYCTQALEHLRGKWGGEIDSFYDEFENRINTLKTTTLPANWDGVVVNTVD